MIEFIETKVNCEVAVENVQSLPNEEYALKRKQGLGATDTSVFLGLMTKFGKTSTTLVSEKTRPYLTEEEKAIGMIEAVRKGRDLEDLILSKFASLMETDKPMKPAHMYRVSSAPYLTVNFDGVMYENECYIPVECKFVTVGGERNYKREYAYKRELTAATPTTDSVAYKDDIIHNIEAHAKRYGIPPYYYAQIQHQMLALGSPYGYLTALHDKNWELCVYRIPRNPMVISAIITEGEKVWKRVEIRNKLRGTAQEQLDNI